MFFITKDLIIKILHKNNKIIDSLKTIFYGIVKSFLILILLKRIYPFLKTL